MGRTAMPHDDWDHDEDWADDDDDYDADEPARCPECDGPVHSISDRCPACGYWLSEADRRVRWAGAAKPTWLRITAIIVLIAFLVSLVAAGAAMF